MRHNLEFKTDRGTVDVDHVVFGPDGVFRSSPSGRMHHGMRTATTTPSVKPGEAHTMSDACCERQFEVQVVPVVVQWGPGGWADVDWTVRWFDGVLAFRGDAGAPVLEEIEGIRRALAPDVLDRAAPRSIPCRRSPVAGARVADLQPVEEGVERGGDLVEVASGSSD